MRNWFKYSFMPTFRTKRDKIVMAIVWKLPIRIVYWCVVRATINSVPNNECPSEIKAIDVLKRFGARL